MSIPWSVPSDLDGSCANLCIALNALSGVETVESCCGHGTAPFRIWIKFTGDSQSIGIRKLRRCLSGRYYCYKAGELRNDPEWRLHMEDGDRDVVFLLEGKIMSAFYDGAFHNPAEILAKNLLECSI